ncbi:unnamed protein product [Brachionus calyciflorus]|uniref:U5 small nuclear ribonucleoprotein 200 kDa helicase n=1 Tax=Brachionus calyciflorus TaxID=104777 RepID=A0A813WYN4_9BILA|nr:unnamed protein product [Brachionus calyciflorus]
MYLEDQLQLPRLTGTLRAFSKVCKKYEEIDPLIEKELIKKRRQQLLNPNNPTQIEFNFTWPSVQTKLIPNPSDSKYSKLKSFLEKLKSNISKQFLNEDFNDNTILNESSLFILELFYDFQNKSGVGNSNFQNLDKISKRLRDKFGQFQRNLFENCRDLMECIFNELIYINRINLLDEIFANRKIEIEPDQNTSDILFGQQIKFYSFYEQNEIELDDLIETESEEETEEFQFEFPIKTETQNESNLEWTRQIANDLQPLVMEILIKKTKNEEIQNELFELLGFEKFEIIEFLLSNRNHVITSYNKNFNKLNKPSSGPVALSSTITVHTESEKRLKKQMRKEQKQMGEFDPGNLRKLREDQLKEAKLLQIYNQKRLESLTPGQLSKKAALYPFVFDSLLKAAQTSAFIAGSRILLPENIQRTDTNSFEEVFIPAVDSISLADPQKFKNTNEEICLREFIKICDLDDLGKIAFKGFKTLNRIQSIVFETAYNTNNNLLICAPTGAGKTNIAMLAICNEIRKHFQQGGVLRKDQFKIVYIAPMKALAAEMTENFSKRLEPLGLVVKELTGDMQLTKQEILETQMLVVTPEKWDVVTRKSVGDDSLSLLVKLLIIDEVHLLHDDRGSVIETIVARTLRQVESSQKMIRIVGLSATLPNYMDVARFLSVDPYKGLFFFDSRFRPVPLAQTFIGVKSSNKLMQQQQMDDVCYEKVLKMVKLGHQVMVFVHARNATLKTALKLRDIAKNSGEIGFFIPEDSREYGDAQKQMSKSRNKQLRDVFIDGFSVHHAGLLRSDRNMVEKLFAAGHIKVLVCTATLAWGVNLPAHAVVIKGTEMYDSKKGSFVDISMLDILQIFGRAGRPQFDKSGEAFIITTHDKLANYLNLLTRQTPIESQFLNNLADNLNAEVCLGSVTNVQEAVRWLSYTYLFVRMKLNPLAYGLTYKMMENDPGLELYREDIIRTAGRLLDKAHMLRFDEASGNLNPTDLGRTSSHFYIKYDTIELFNQKLKENMNEKEIIGLISECSEFQQLKVRDEEMPELDLLHENCVLPVMGGVENSFGKVNCLIQSYISRSRVEGFSLVSDMAYISQNLGRIARGIYEICIKRGWALMSGRMLMICKAIEKQLWHFQSPMRQFENVLTYEILEKIENKNLSIDKMRDMDSKELGLMLHHQKMSERVKMCLQGFPVIDIDTTIHPITRTVLRVKITLTGNFKWNDKLHGQSEFFWIWIEDPVHNHIYHYEHFNFQKKFVKLKQPQLVVFTIPIFEPLPSQYIVRVISDKWLGVEFTHSVSFKHLILPDQHPPHTELLDLDPLPVTALNNPLFQSLYSFSHFNPIQTQIFHCYYHTDNNSLLGAPTGSGKTIAAELAMFRVFNKNEGKKVVYIAPLKALVRERMLDWKVRLEEKLNIKVVELTGDVTPDMKIIAESDVIVSTPEKWDGISRSWQTRNYVKDVALIIIDEIHLLGEDRGPVLEVIVSRTNFISSHTNYPVRVIGLSTALANAMDLANWLGIKQMGLYNFKPSVRPVPLEVHIQGFPGKFYCPRMATMNKPCFQEIQIHSPAKPVLIFVSSRRQTRLTALDLISYLALDSRPKQWLNMPESEINLLINQVSDQNLKLTLAFGIGMHHAGLNDKDRKLVEELFVNLKIQILIATSTLAWGVNFPAHLVIVKGTEFYDGKTKRYVDFPITDVLQMMGRAGRPQFDDSGIAVIMVHDVKKHFYKKFLYEPFPVESSLLSVLPDHLNAEIVATTITSKQEAMEYLTWTYFFRRLLVNPSYYELESIEPKDLNKFLSNLIQVSLSQLEVSGCIQIGDSGEVSASTNGKIASFYYLTHTTLKMFRDTLNDDTDIESLIDIVSLSSEFDEFPVRHNEDKLNETLSKEVPLKVNPYSFDSPHTKVNLILQAHFTRAPLPIADYYTDTKSVLDNCLRIMQAILDFCADKGWLKVSLSVINLMQMVCQGRWLNDSDLLSLPHIEHEHLNRFYTNKIDCLPSLIEECEKSQDYLHNLAGDILDQTQIRDIQNTVMILPKLEIAISLSGLVPDKRAKKVFKEEDSVSKLYMDNFTKELFDLYEDEEYVFNLEVKRINKQKKFGKDFKAYAPKYHKPKDENWLVVLGSNTMDESDHELISFKRLTSFKNQQTSHVMFKTPLITENPKGDLFDLTIFFMSDVYLGLDQQFDFKFKLNRRK